MEKTTTEIKDKRMNTKPEHGPHVCPECSCNCTCSDHPCACCNEEGEKKDWMKLSKEQKLEIISIADSLGIPPNFVQDMYERGEIDYETE